MAQAPKKDWEGLNVTPGKKDPNMNYVFVPFNYREAQAALKEAGAKWAGSQWGIAKDAFEANEAKIRAAAKADMDLGVDGRKAREDALKADAPAKAPKEKAEKKELTAEEKAAKAEASRAAALERDKTRVPVVAGSVEAGGTVVVDGEEVTVSKVGKAFELDEKGAADLAERFNAEFKAGDKVAYATYEPAPAAEPSM